jgi:hypothetical protein
VTVPAAAGMVVRSGSTVNVQAGTDW